jgi:quinoprotein glucose dehydrogenase
MIWYGIVRCWTYLVLPLVALAADSDGPKQFAISCAPCHGAQGEGGRGPALAVAWLPRAPDDAALGSIIASGIPGTQMPGTRMMDDERHSLVQFIRNLGTSHASAIEGDRASGERIFWGKGNCGRCHTVGARGGRMGPDLSEIALRRGAVYLRAVLLDPAGNIPDSFTFYRRVVFAPDTFVQVQVVTNSGVAITGVRVDEDAFTIQIRDYSDRLYSFRKDELKELVKEWGKTPMPSYRDRLSETEMRDLVAYLLSLRGSD